MLRVTQGISEPRDFIQVLCLTPKPRPISLHGYYQKRLMSVLLLLSSALKERCLGISAMM